MNAPFRPETAEERAERRGFEAGLAGLPSLPETYVETERRSYEASYGLGRAERLAEQAWLDLREECEAEFIEWQRAWRGSEFANNSREEVGFSEWLIGQARQFGGKYLEALDRVERQSLGKGRVGL